jgi:hypothetical protein
MQFSTLLDCFYQSGHPLAGVYLPDVGQKPMLSALQARYERLQHIAGVMHGGSPIANLCTIGKYDHVVELSVNPL